MTDVKKRGGKKPPSRDRLHRRKKGPLTREAGEKKIGKSSFKKMPNEEKKRGNSELQEPLCRTNENELKTPPKKQKKKSGEYRIKSGGRKRPNGWGGREKKPQ